MKKFIHAYELHNVALITLLYLLSLLFFFLFRLSLFISQLDAISDAGLLQILHAFVNGVRFDLVISGYLLLLPFLVVSILALMHYRGRIIYSAVLWFIILLYTIAFFIHAADIPYYGQFQRRFSVSAFEWLDTPGIVIKMILQEPRYWLYLLLFGGLLSAFIYLLKKLFSNSFFFIHPMRRWLRISVTLLILALMLLGIRGRVEKKSPIRIGTAYFCNNPMLNALGLNPVFTLLHSALEQRKMKSIQLMDDKKALTLVQYYLHLQHPDSTFPLARKIRCNTPMLRSNVIIIIMESMSAAKMQRHGNPDHLTPFLDSLSNKGLYFEHCYTTGIHTYNGIFSTLFSLPALPQQHPMKESTMRTWPGITYTLNDLGYNTIYFTTHDGQFDNVEGFLKQNQFERVVEAADYPDDQKATALGVPDDFMFRFSVPVLNELHAHKKPFLSVFMTASDHGPYHIPDYFKPRSEELKKGIVEYADYSLRTFIQFAQKQPWYNNTLFVFVADHGAPMSNALPIAPEYVHTPLLFFMPGADVHPRSYTCMASQMDIFPTVMGLLKANYTNATMGIDLLKEQRPYAFFCTDNNYGVADSSDFLVIEPNRPPLLYHLFSTDRCDDYTTANLPKVQAMKVYAESHMQVYQYLKKK